MANKVIANLEVVLKGKNIQVVQKDLKNTKKVMDDTAASTKKAGTEVDKYGRKIKGTAGISSNSTKNFSKMQQNIGGNDGSGGLVRAYALLAANVFALTAAFGVLQRSAQIDQLTVSMEILSTRGGTSIDILSKKIVAASGGAIDLASSFRQVSLASSAGLNTAEIEGLTRVARGAAISLGRDLPDALDRIFRGAIKLEPEILDEIGLFVRVDEASRNYAQQLGRTVSSLSQVDKRQAFLNAILEQGTKKFDEYADAVEPDAFTKLAAALKDIAQDLTSFLNSALGPLVSFLAESRGVLSIVFVALAGSLLKQAIPALGQFTSQSAETAQMALADAQAYSKAVRQKANAQIDANLKRLRNEQKTNKAIARSAEEATQTGPKFRSRAKAAADARARLNEKGLTTSKRQKAVQEQIKVLEAAREKSKEKTVKIIDKELKLLAKEEAALEKILQTEKEIRDVKSGKRGVDPQSVAGRREASLADKALVTGALATTIGTAETAGVGEAFKVLGAESDKLKEKLNTNSKMTKAFRLGMFKLNGTVGILATGLQGLMATLMPYAIIIGAIVAVSAALFAKFATGQKELKALNSTIEDTNAITEKLNERFSKQIEIMNNLGGDSGFGTILQANIAFTKQSREVIGQIVKINKELKEFKTASNGLQNAWQAVLAAFGGGAENNAIEATSAAFKELVQAQIEAGKTDLAKVLLQDANVGEQTIAAFTGAEEASKRYSLAQQAVKQDSDLSKQTITQLFNQFSVLSKDFDATHYGMQNFTDEQKRMVLELFNSKDALQENSAALLNFEVKTEDAATAGKTFDAILKEQEIRLVSFQGALDGAGEAIGKLQQSFLVTTKVDEVVGSIESIRGSYMGLFDDLGSGVTSLNAETANDFLEKFGQQEFSKLFSPEEMSKIANIAKGELTDGFETPQAAADDLFKTLEEEFKQFQDDIITSKLELENLGKQLKTLQSASALGAQAGASIQQKVVDIATENKNIAITNQKALARTVGLEGENLATILNVIRGKTKENELTGALKQKFESLTETQKLALQNSDEAVRQKQVELTIQERLNDANEGAFGVVKENLKAQQKTLAISKELFNQEQKLVTLKQKLSAGGLGQNEILTQKQALETAEETFNMAVKEAALKTQLQVVDLEILKIRLDVLAKEDASKAAQYNALIATIGDQNSGIIGELNKGLNTALQVAGYSFADTVREGLIGGRGGGAGGIAQTMAKLSTFNKEKEIEKAEKERGMKLNAGAKLDDPEILALDAKIEALGALDSAYLKITGSMKLYAAQLSKLGPEGEASAALLNGIVTIGDGFKSMKTVLDESTSGTEKFAAVAEFASSSIGAIGDIMAANSRAQVAEIDQQIQAEKNRDGKSAESINKIKAMEKKKEMIQRKAFEQNKKIQLAQAVVNGMSAIQSGFATQPFFPVGIAMGIMATAMTAMQISAIRKQQFQGGAQETPAPQTALSVGKRSNAVDVSKRATGGELNYLRGGVTTGQNLGGAGGSFQGGAMGRKGYANGGDGIIVGERGPEVITPSAPVDITPNFALGGGTQNVNFTINAVDAAGVEDVLMNQRGNIIRMIREAANENGTMFLEEIDTQAYGSSR